MHWLLKYILKCINKLIFPCIAKAYIFIYTALKLIWLFIFRIPITVFVYTLCLCLWCMYTVFIIKTKLYWKLFGESWKRFKLYGGSHKNKVWELLLYCINACKYTEIVMFNIYMHLFLYFSICLDHNSPHTDDFEQVIITVEVFTSKRTLGIVYMHKLEAKVSRLPESKSYNVYWHMTKKFATENVFKCKVFITILYCFKTVCICYFKNNFYILKSKLST